MKILELRSVAKVFSAGAVDTQVLANINFSIQKSEVICLVGPSGSGKTTFLQIAGLLDSPISGEVFFDKIKCNTLSDDAITEIRGNKIGFIYQFHHLLPELSALENAALPLLIHSAKNSDALKSAEDILKSLGLGHRLNNLPHELSGGEQQRVAIARALITKPKLLLADEPTGNLDQSNADNIIELIFKEVRSRGLATIIVTHNMEIAKRADKILTIKDGKIATL